MTDDTASWTVDVSRTTDAAVRDHLARSGMTEADLSRFIEDAVRWRLFDRNLAEVRAGFADLSPDQVQALVDEAVTAVREEGRRPPSKAE